MTTLKNPVKDWVPLNFLVKNVYPKIHHSILVYCTPKSQSEFSENFKKKYASFNGRKQALICLFKSVKFIIDAVISKISGLDSKVFLSILSKIVGDDSVYDFISTTDKFVEFPGNLYFIHFIQSGLKHSYPYNQFMLNCHLILMLCGYLFTLKSADHTSDIQFSSLLDCLDKYVCCSKEGSSFEYVYPENILNFVFKREIQDHSLIRSVDSLMTELDIHTESFEPNNPDKLSQSLVYILGYHHIRCNLTTESPFGLFALKSQHLGFEYDPQIHPIHVLRFLKFDEDRDEEIDKDGGKKEHEVVIVIPQVRIASQKHLGEINTLAKHGWIGPEGLDYDFFLNIKSLNSMSKLHRTLDSNKEETV